MGGDVDHQANGEGKGKVQGDSVHRGGWGLDCCAVKIHVDAVKSV